MRFGKLLGRSARPQPFSPTDFIGIVGAPLWTDAVGKIADRRGAVATWRRLAGATSRSKLTSSVQIALSRFAEGSGTQRGLIVDGFAHVLGLAIRGPT